MNLMNLKKLKEIIPFKWRVQSKFNTKDGVKLKMIAYVDARDVQDKLDEVVGIGNWQDEYYSEKGTLICKIGIKIGDEWIWKSGAGSESKMEAKKGEASDAFKRAGVKWGINRDAYKVEMVILPAKEYNQKFYPVSATGKFLKGQELHNHCNRMAKIDEMDNFIITNDDLE